MLAFLLAALQIIPGVASVIQGIAGKYFDAKVAITQAKLGVDRDKAIAILQNVASADHEATARLSVIASSTGLMVIVFGFALPWILYEWKVVFVDNVLGPGCVSWYFGKACWVGETLPIKGVVGDWGGTIIAAIFGSGTAVTVARMWFSKDKPNGP